MRGETILFVSASSSQDAPGMHDAHGTDLSTVSCLSLHPTHLTQACLTHG